MPKVMAYDIDCFLGIRFVLGKLREEGRRREFVEKTKQASRLFRVIGRPGSPPPELLVHKGKSGS